MPPKRPSLRSTNSNEPINIGVETTLLDGDSLGQGQMYVRNNFLYPPRLPGGFDVVVPGKATRRITLGMLASFREVEVDLVLECAGNGRLFMDPVPDGTPWALDAASPISVAGVHLVDVLGRLPSGVSNVVFTGADQGLLPIVGRQPYQFSITRELAESSLPILVTHIDGEALTAEHGAPVRLIVPGHYAMMSVKWLTRIEAIPYAFQGHFVRKYRYYGDTTEPEGTPVGEIAVRSIISAPVDDAQLRAGQVDVSGSAWTGAGKLTGVEVSTDDGATWNETRLARQATGGRFAAVRWTASVAVEPGPVIIVARATDSTGATQPLDPRWNSNGYANNVVQRVSVTVV